MPIEILFVIGTVGFILTIRAFLSVLLCLRFSVSLLFSSKETTRRYLAKGMVSYFKNNWTTLAFGVEGAVMMVLSYLVANM